MCRRSRYLHCPNGFVANIRKGVFLCLFLTVFLIIYVGLDACFHPVNGQLQKTTEMEYRIKAAFLLNFTKFVSWPNDRQEEKNISITICVLGKDPFGTAFDSIRGKKVQGRKINIVFSSNMKEIPPCHVLFISKGLENMETGILSQAINKPILTVGETNSFANRGGMINFIMVDNTVRFEINPIAVENANLKMSSQLLKLAVIVETNKLVEK